MASSSPLLASPADILYPVLASLPGADLYSLCLTCNALRTLAEPFLYSTVQWAWERSHQTPPITRFLRSILRRPQLASFVRTVILTGDSFRRPPPYRGPSPRLPVNNKADLDDLVACINWINVPYRDLWIQQLCDGAMDAFVALLLSQLANLRCLRLDKNFTRENHLVGRMLRQALCTEPQNNSRLPSFGRLRDVSVVYFRLGIDIRDYTDARNTADVLPLFYLPSVERIATAIDNPVVFAWPAAHPPGPSRLSCLDLSMIREGHLGRVLSIAKGLKKLRWDWYYRPDIEDRVVTDIVDLDQIGADLSHVQETLTDLNISGGADMSRAEPEFPPLAITGQFTAFRNLNTLETLVIPLPMLLGFSPSRGKRLDEILPRNIEFLTITDNMCFQEEWDWSDVSIVQVLRLWLQDWRKSTPCLRRLCLLMRVANYKDSGNWGPTTRQELTDLCAQVGIQVEITNVATDPELY